MDTPFTGLTAKVSIGAVVLGYMSGFDLSLEKDVIEIISFGTKYKEKVPSMKNWTASVDGTFAMNSGSSQEILYTAYANDTVLTISTYLDDTTFFSGSALVKGLKISAKPDDKTSITCDFEGSGAIIRSLNGVNKSILASAIDAATAWCNSRVVGILSGNTTQIGKTAYLASIATAVVVRDNVAATQVQTDAAVSTLATATATFDLTIIA